MRSTGALGAAGWLALTLVSGPAALAQSEPPATPPLPAAHRPEITLDLREPEGGTFTGDLAVLEVVVVTRHPGDDVAIPAETVTASAPSAPPPGADEPAPGSVEVHARRAEVDPDDPRRHVFALSLLAVAPGPVTVGPLQVRVVTQDGVIGEVDTPPLSFEVRSVLGNEPTPEPRPRTAPVPVYQDDYTLAWLLGALAFAAAIAALTLWLARWWRRRQGSAPAPVPVDRPPWEVAQEKLRALRNGRAQAVSDGRGDAWADALSDVIREYLGARCGFDGLESTTDEVIAKVEAARPRGLRLAEVVALLGDCDLVKFAQAPLDEGQGESLLQAAEGLVRATTPHPEDGPRLDPGPPGGGAPGSSRPAPPRAPGSQPPGEVGAGGRGSPPSSPAPGDPEARP